MVIQLIWGFLKTVFKILWDKIQVRFLETHSSVLELTYSSLLDSFKILRDSFKSRLHNVTLKIWINQNSVFTNGRTMARYLNHFENYVPKICVCIYGLSHFSSIWLWDPMDCSLQGSSVDGISQARILEWVAMPSSMGSSQPKDRTGVSCTSFIAGGFFIA